MQGAWRKREVLSRKRCVRGKPYTAAAGLTKRVSMRYEPTRLSLNDLISPTLLRSLKIQAELLGRVRKAVPAALAVHCRYCVMREDGRMVVFTDSPAWATRLRFYSPSLLAALNADGGMPIGEILVRTLRIESPTRTVKPMEEPSPRAIEAVKASVAAAVCPEVGESLARLGMTMERYAGKNDDAARV